MPLPPDAKAWWWVLLLSGVAAVPISFSGLGFWLTDFYSNLYKGWFGHSFAEGLELGGLFLALLLNILYPLGFFWGYLAMLPLRHQMPWVWGIGILTTLLWTLAVFTGLYLKALAEARLLGGRCQKK
ncbi:MAG: hypothetical protein Q6K85_04085 [Thermostichus sp. DG02_1_bins_55]